MMPGTRPAHLLVILWVTQLTLASAQTPALSADEKKQFLRTAEIVSAEQSQTGVTKPWRLTLSDGRLTHDASFQSVDERKDVARLGRSQELNFVDSYRYNIAAYELAELVGLGDMVPVTVARTWRGRPGALSWWVADVMFDEATRIREGRRPEDVQAWSQDLARMLVFTELVYDTDRNKTNILYTRDWQIFMIDFTRAFRVWDELRRQDDLYRIDRRLFERLQMLTPDAVRQATRPHLNFGEVEGVMQRRGQIVEHFQRLVNERGASVVLYD